MTTEDELKSEPSIVRCWLKKIYSVSVKVGMYLGGFAVALTAAYIIWLGATSQKAAEIWTTFTHWCGSASAIRPWVTETICIGTMNHMHRSDFAESEMQWYDRMLEINSKENMQKIWEANQNNKQIRWKDSVQKLLGISQTGELIKTRTACGNI